MSSLRRACGTLPITCMKAGCTALIKVHDPFYQEPPTLQHFCVIQVLEYLDVLPIQKLGVACAVAIHNINPSEPLRVVDKSDA